MKNNIEVLLNKKSVNQFCGIKNKFKYSDEELIEMKLRLIDVYESAPIELKGKNLSYIKAAKKESGKFLSAVVVVDGEVEHRCIADTEDQLKHWVDKYGL